MEEVIEIAKFNPCKEGYEFRQQYVTFEEAWNACTRGDWMLWLAKKLKVDLLKLITAKALCANTVRHLLKDERSIKAIDVAIAFGEGKATREELDAAALDADAAVGDAAAVSSGDDYVGIAAVSAAGAADTSHIAANAVASYAANAAGAYSTHADAKKENQLRTANICREVLTEEVFKVLIFNKQRLC